MSKETTKSLPLRTRHIEQYLKGIGIDIGAGDDPLPLPGVETWDWSNGDANLMSGAKLCYYDYVYSSHCLEHMYNIKEVLKTWSKLLKPGGYMFTVVPDWELYEKCMWPSKFNGDHKHTFSTKFTKEDVGRSNHFHIEDIKLLFNIIQMELIEFGVEDLNYDYDKGNIDQTSGNALSQIYFVGKKFL